MTPKMKQRITPLVSSLLSAIPVPALASTPLGEILFYNNAWDRILSPLVGDARRAEQPPTSLHQYLSTFGLSPEVVEQWILRSLEHGLEEGGDPSIPLLRPPAIPYVFSFKPVRSDGIALLLVTAVPSSDPSVTNVRQPSEEAPYGAQQEAIIHRLRDEVTRLQDDLGKVSSVGSQFIPEIGHEYRTPLTSILGLLELALLKPLPDQIRQHLSEAQRAALDLLTIVNDAVDFSALDAGSYPLRNTPTSVEDLVGRILTLTSRHALVQKLEVVGKIAETVPPRVMVDERRFGQVLLNTLLFIIDHATPRGGIVIYVEHETEDFRPEDTAPILRISLGYWDDHITDEEVRRLFANSSNRLTEKSSSSTLSRLRLSLVGKVLDRLGGGVNIRHIPRRGVRIELSIPVGEAGKTSAAVQEVSHTPPQMRRKILIAEDNAVNARVMALMLEHLNAQFVLVKNGFEAIEAVKNHDSGFELILMDCQMPEVDGFEATRAIRSLEGEHSQRTPIVAMTAYALPGAREACLEAGMDGYLLKPISAKQLAEALAQFGIS